MTPRSIVLHRRFEKMYVKQSPKIQKAFKERRNLFLSAPENPLLNIHALHGIYAGYYSFSVTGDVRVIFKLLDGHVAFFVAIGTHAELYR